MLPERFVAIWLFGSFKKKTLSSLVVVKIVPDFADKIINRTLGML